MEHKLFRKLELKTFDQPGMFSGILSIYGGIDEYNDRILPGAYTKTIKENGGRVPLLWQHDPAEPIGELALEDTQRGLAVTGRLVLADDVPAARKAYALLKAGVIRGLSIGFRPIKSMVVNGIREISEARLFEGSIVTFNADPEAHVSVVKATRSEATDAELRAAFDETFAKWHAKLDRMRFQDELWKAMNS